MRDTQLDIYRGFAMVYIVCFIHVISWFHIGNEPFVSLVLFEMPIIFFIAGAAQSLSKKQKSFRKIVWSRFKRVVLPFYVYALVSLAIILLLTLVYKNFYSQILASFGENVANKYSFDIFAYTLKDFKQILLCQNIPQSPIMWHVWFVIPYFILSCLFWLQQKAVRLISRGGVFWLLLSSLYCNMAIQNRGTIKTAGNI